MSDIRRTIPRTRDLDYLNPFQAATAVDRFIGAPQRSGPWYTGRWLVDEQAGMVELIKEQYGSQPGRAVPPGDYIMLKHDEIGAMMSNTPDEISDHAPAFRDATGDVLIHGLGLSCVVSGLLAKPEVRHIDVVDLEPDVIAMVAPAYEYEHRVTIHQANAIEKEWPAGKRWDYAWHDIWAKIAADNLDPATAENGISYGMFFDRFRDRVVKQDAWAFRLAKLMNRAADYAEEFSEEWHRRWRDSNREERMAMLFEYHEKSQRMQVPPGAYEKLVEMSPDLKAQFEKATERDDAEFLWPDHLFRDRALEEFPEDEAEQETRVRMLFDG